MGAQGITVGRFRVWFDNYPRGANVEGPSSYLATARFDKRLSEIATGRDVVANESIRQTANPALATALSLQVDYAAWLGDQELLRYMNGGQR